MKAIVIGTEMEVVKHMREMKEDTRSVGFDEELERYARRLRASVDARAKRPGEPEQNCPFGAEGAGSRNSSL